MQMSITYSFLVQTVVLKVTITKLNQIISQYKILLQIKLLPIDKKVTFVTSMFIDNDLIAPYYR